MNLSDKTVCIVDTGTFIHVCFNFREAFGRTLLFCGAGEESDPSTRIARIGSGIEGVQVISPMLHGKMRGIGFWDLVPEIDLFVFPGVERPDVQERLRAMGKRVWGAGHSADLELFRMEAKEFMKKAGLPVQKYQVIIGLDRLREFLASTKDTKYVKISGLRGDAESFCHKGDYRTSEHILDRLRYKFGRIACERMEFLIEDELPDCIESGSDQYVVRGQLPPRVFIGLEKKDSCYLMTHMALDSLPPPLRKPLDALAAASADYESSNWLSTEVRIPEDDPSTGYLLEPTERLGAPPGELEMLMVKNWPLVCWHGAEGELVPMEITDKIGMMAIIDTDMGEAQAKTIVVPEEVEPWARFRNYCVEDGAFTILPQHGGMTAVGAVCAIGDDIISTAKVLEKRAKAINGQGLHIFVNAIPEALVDIIKAQKMGIPFGEGIELPSPEEVAKIISE